MGIGCQVGFDDLVSIGCGQLVGIGCQVGFDDLASIGCGLLGGHWLSGWP